ncbi:hypothetical protein GWK47_012241 [Chionoecetes opilio]|uniref:Uncharacterized protein n=1 Tax=Chionoecetes opilio TaxID=41210 RepID=A0A8J5CM53_CHIOP|nr:hypothetical protein GWK47_012241 [Chionoecetes opilio]
MNPIQQGAGSRGKGLHPSMLYMRNCESFCDARLKLWQEKNETPILKPQKLLLSSFYDVSFNEERTTRYLSWSLMLNLPRAQYPTLANPNMDGSSRGRIVLHTNVVPPDTPGTCVSPEKSFKCGLRAATRDALKEMHCKAPADLQPSSANARGEMGATTNRHLNFANNFFRNLKDYVIVNV